MTKIDKRVAEDIRYAIEWLRRHRASGQRIMKSAEALLGQTERGQRVAEARFRYASWCCRNSMLKERMAEVVAAVHGVASAAGRLDRAARALAALVRMNEDLAAPRPRGLGLIMPHPRSLASAPKGRDGGSGDAFEMNWPARARAAMAAEKKEQALLAAKWDVK